MEIEKSKHIFMAIVQSQDIDLAEQVIKENGAVCYRLPSVGGFLGRKNATLIIHMPENQQDVIIGILQKTCSQRIEYIAVPLESAPLTLPTPTPVTVGGATVFEIEVEDIFEL